MATMTEALREFLEDVARAMKASSRSGWPFPCFEAFVLAHGREWSWRSVPSGTAYNPGQPKECFRNAAHLILGGGDGSEQTYCEGYAAHADTLFPVHHAWVVDATGSVIDTTPIFAGGGAYFGVAFDGRFVRRSLLEYRTYSMLDQAKARFPLLRGAVAPNEFLSARWRQQCPTTTK